MRRHVLSLSTFPFLVTGALALVVCAGCADGSTPTSPSTGVGGGGGQSGAGGQGSGGDDDTSGPSSTTKASATSTGSSGDGGSGQGGETSSSGGGEGGTTSSSQGGAGGDGGGGGCGVECPDGFFDIDNNPLTGECGCEYECEKASDDDPIDEDFTDDNCDGGDGEVEACVYVSASAGNDGNQGTRAAPMQTVANAIARAVENGVPAVCLSGEDYFENVIMASGVSVYGGFDHTNADFPFRRSEDATTLVAAEGTVFYADNIAVDTHIEGMNIEASTPSGEGESTYGVRLKGGVGELFVRFNEITVANGTAGANGTDGTAPPSAQATIGGTGGIGYEEQPGSGQGANAVACTEAGGFGGDGGYDYGGGIDGGTGNGGALGGDGGSIPGECGDGGPGDNGTPGMPGTIGATGTGGTAPAIAVSLAAFVPAAGTNGGNGTNGKGGGGGGGGGGGPYEFNVPFGPYCVEDHGGGGGSGGCGGIGGKLGTGGAGGGGSFGVFAAGGKITVADNQINTGSGGNGGPGGDGGQRQLGGDPGPGGDGEFQGGKGGNGGKGGDGGVGGPGGGGAGGPSICFARTSTVVFDYDSSCSTGLPGNGGLGGVNTVGGQASAGSTGLVGPQVQLTAQ